MLRIRPAQVQAFERAALRRFEDEMVGHLAKFAPKHSEILGEEGVRKVIRLGFERADKYGLTNRGPMRSYIELMFMFGSDFDTDPQLPWAAQILGDQDEKDQMKRADRLFAKTMEFRTQVMGPEGEYTRDALHRAMAERFEELPVSEGDFESGVLARLDALHPRRYQRVGGEPLRHLVRRGRELAKQHGLDGNAGAALLGEMMFLLGHGCAADPQFPWIEGALTDPSVARADRRLKRLHAAWVTYLNHLLGSKQKDRTP